MTCSSRIPEIRNSEFHRDGSRWHFCTQKWRHVLRLTPADVETKRYARTKWHRQSRRVLGVWCSYSASPDAILLLHP